MDLYINGFPSKSHDSCKIIRWTTSYKAREDTVTVLNAKPSIYDMYQILLQPSQLNFAVILLPNVIALVSILIGI